jgi:hypothetical protein
LHQACSMLNAAGLVLAISWEERRSQDEKDHCIGYPGNLRI